MTAEKDDYQLRREEIHLRVIGRWENEGGSVRENPASVVGEIGDAEAANIRVRLIALENIIVALLANGAEDRLELVREMAEFISPRPGMTPHRLTIEAARNMLAIIERAEHYRKNRR